MWRGTVVKELFLTRINPYMLGRLLQLRYKVDKSKYISTIAPTGKWKGVYFSEELKNAEKYGYKIKIIKGFLFDKKLVFSDYVDILYQIKKIILNLL